MLRAFLKSGLGALFCATMFIASSASAQSVTAVEYYNLQYGHYFVTASQAEIDALDDNPESGWWRTGQTFEVFPVDTANAVNVCRFWSGQTFAPKSSHVYTLPEECEVVKANADWVYEGEAFAVKETDERGFCERGATIPLYRLYNDGVTGAPNHRYTTSVDVAGIMVKLGYIPERNAETYIYACVPLSPVGPR